MAQKKTVWMTEVALMAAVLCVLAPFSIPIGEIPITLATFAVYLTAAILGSKKGTASVLIYLLIGMVGVPVFSNFTGGAAKLAGPTGGYLIGYLPCAFLVGFLAEREFKAIKNLNGVAKNAFELIHSALAMVLGTVLCYLFGTAWFMYQMSETYTVAQALAICVVPYLAFDTVKIVLATAIAVPIRKLLKKNGML